MNASEARESGKPKLLDAAGRTLLVIGVVVALVFVGAMLRATDGHFVPQVVDLYVTCQYAKALAAGHPFQYNPGEERSTGATSLLHMTLLGVAYGLGARGEALIAFAIALGAICYLLTILLARRLGAEIAGERAGMLAGLLVALGGPAVWGFLYGADIALYMLLATWLCERLAAEWERAIPRFAILACSLLVLTRPEGAVFAIVLSPLWWRRAAARASLPRRFVTLTPLAIALGATLFQRALTGSWLGTSFADKSLFANYGLWDGVALSAEYLMDLIRGLLLGFYPPSAPIGFTRGNATLYFPPLALVFILLAVCSPRGRGARALRVWGWLVALIFVLLTPNVFMGVHFNRYLMWAFPSLSTLTAIGMDRASEALTGGRPAGGQWIFKTLSVLAVGLGLLSTARIAAQYADSAANVYARDVKTAEWIRRNLPSGASLANVATSVEYLTGHRNLNLHGVTSPAFFGNRTAEREAGTWESLSRLPAGDRPPYLITSVEAQKSYATLRALVVDPPLFQSQSLSDEILIYRTRFDAVGMSRLPRRASTLEAIEGWEAVDRLNVCDGRDERAHAYRFQSRIAGVTLWGATRIAAVDEDPAGARLIDAGRAILGEERFAIRTRPSRELLVVMRTARDHEALTWRASGVGRVTVEFPKAAVIVRVDDRIAARAALEPARGFDEWLIRLPASAIAGERTRLRLAGRYASFYYWFYQR